MKLGAGIWGDYHGGKSHSGKSGGDEGGPARRRKAAAPEGGTVQRLGGRQRPTPPVCGRRLSQRREVRELLPQKIEELRGLGNSCVGNLGNSCVGNLGDSCGKNSPNLSLRASGDYSGVNSE